MSTIKNPAFFHQLDSTIPCDQCGNEIVYVGPHWDHVPIEGAKPSHVAMLPDRFNHFFEPERFKAEVGVSAHIPGSKFAKIDLWVISEKAKNMANAPGQKQMWAQAYWALALAADHLHAMFARDTAPEDTRQIIQRDDLAEEGVKGEPG